jgi:N-methylhydantoinase B
MTDALTISILWKTLISIADEMGTALRRTAFSSAVREGEDFSTGLFDRQGRLIAQGNFTPGHMGSMPYVLDAVLAAFPGEALGPGDGVMLNDSALGSGHFPDIFVVMPVHDDGALVGWVVNAAHHVDVGGAAPGSQQVHGITEAYQEGLRLPPVRFLHGGRMDRDIVAILRANVRQPDKLMGDLQAQVNANHVGAARLVATIRHHGMETVDAGVEAILLLSETEARARIAALPDGRYSFADVFDDSGPGTPPINVRVTVIVSGGEITVDFAGSDPAVSAAINSYMNYTRAYTFFAVKVLTGSDMPQNAGAIRPVTAMAPEGSFFNPAFPAPSGGRAAVQVRIFDAISGAFAQIAPDRAMAAFSHWANPNFGGVDPATGKPFVLYDLIFGGYGAHAGGDGLEALSPVMNCSSIPVEVQETAAPVRIRRWEFLTDSAGPGRHRGGSGVVKEIEFLSDGVRGTMLGDRHVSRPFGLAGGGAGQRARTVLNPDTDAEELASKGVYDFRRGDVIRFELSGAGGHGDPRRRDRAAVARDLADGMISPRHAREVYGHGEDEG